MSSMIRKRLLVFLIPSVVLLISRVLVYANNTDRFNYRGTDGRNFGPENWDKVTCDKVGECRGWPESWEFGVGWDLKESGNMCRNCANRDCGAHMQGPVNVRRKTGLVFNEYKECEDVHWMKYHDGACNWEDMTNNREARHRNNFFIREHSLQIQQPIGDNGRLQCPKGYGGHFPKLDYSKGFPEWWHLHFTDFKVPSEFTQDGVRYDGTIMYQQFYELQYDKQGKTGPRKKDGTVVVNFHAYSDVAPDPHMDKIICQFRRTEDAVREACGLDSVPNHYPGCWNPRRRGRGRKLRGVNNTAPIPAAFAPDVPVSNIVSHKEHMGPTDFDFDKFIDDQIAQGGGNGNWTGHPLLDPERHLVDYGHVPFHHYQFLINVRTEYYHRLRASQTVPPCQEHNHYRIMKDPLRVHPRQVAEIQRLLAERIAPLGAVKECKKETAGKPMEGISGGPAVSVVRPIQRRHSSMKQTFCECKDWPSKWPEDRAWCKIGNQKLEDIGDRERYYERPYNFDAGDKLHET